MRGAGGGRTSFKNCRSWDTKSRVFGYVCRRREGGGASRWDRVRTCLVGSQQQQSRSWPNKKMRRRFHFQSNRNKLNKHTSATSKTKDTTNTWRCRPTVAPSLFDCVNRPTKPDRRSVHISGLLYHGLRTWWTCQPNAVHLTVGRKSSHRGVHSIT